MIEEKLKLNFELRNYGAFDIVNILLNGIAIGSIEVECERDENGLKLIENIYLESQYRHKGYLRQILDFLSMTYGKLYLLPLSQHTEKFKHLGFHFYKQEGEDRYYCRK